MIKIKEYIINETQIKAIVDYLSQQKYIEVYQGINMLLKLKQIEEEKPKGDK